MKIVVAGASGNIGTRVVSQLLDRGERPVMLARNGDKVGKFIARGATHVRVGSDDAAAIIDACRKADALFWVTPPVLSEQSMQGWYARTAAIAVEAIAVNRIQKVVHISSIGAGARPGLGTVSYTGDVEASLAAVCTKLVNLRPGYFMQNLAGTFARVHSDAVLALPFAPDHDIPWISTDDIGDVAAACLADQQWEGQWSRNLMGPENLTPLQIAALMSELLKKPIAYQQLPLEQLDLDFARFGANDVVRAEMRMLLEALGDTDGIYATARTPDAFTPTTLGEYLSGALRAA
jgi:uncharacterized protein YbjT (DUF2867 family)